MAQQPHISLILGHCDPTLLYMTPDYSLAAYPTQHVRCVWCLFV